MQGERTSVLTRPQRRYTYLVWPYGSLTARAACSTLSSALHEVAHAQMQGVTDVWIVRSDGYEIQVGCTSCGRDEEALRVASHPVLRDYWCLACWKVMGRRLVTRRLSPLQLDILRWLREDAQRAQQVIFSSHTDLIKALAADKGNISKSLRNLGLQALLKVNIRLATTDYLSNGYDGL